jgi:hypothetical protein
VLVVNEEKIMVETLQQQEQAEINYKGERGYTYLHRVFNEAFKKQNKTITFDYEGTIFEFKYDRSHRFFINGLKVKSSKETTNQDQTEEILNDIQKIRDVAKDFEIGIGLLELPILYKLTGLIEYARHKQELNKTKGKTPENPLITPFKIRTAKELLQKIVTEKKPLYFTWNDSIYFYEPKDNTITFFDKENESSTDVSEMLNETLQKIR